MLRRRLQELASSAVRRSAALDPLDHDAWQAGSLSTFAQDARSEVWTMRDLIDGKRAHIASWAPPGWTLDVLETPRDGLRLWSLTLSDGERVRLAPLTVDVGQVREAWIRLCSAAWALAEGR